ncbi:MAG: glycosyltransferase family 4 protein [Deltaproteobacteria bacterium]|nr:glycosyltransferase family 4 protein [Deltaproteobacteria bacterium]
MDHKRRVLVCQRGARHRFVVPRLLHESGLLYALYTDSCQLSPLGRLAVRLVGAGMKHPLPAALASRNPVGIPEDRVFCSDALVMPRFLGGRRSLGAIYKNWGLGQASIIYSMYGEEAEFLEWAKGEGARIIVDVFVHPKTNRIVANEERLILGKAERPSAEEDAHSRRVFELADILLCPSEWVAEGVGEFLPGAESKIRVSPYGSSVAPNPTVNNPVPGRILFAGREPLRKGLHHLAEAAGILRQGGMELDVRVAGVDAADIDWIEHGDQLNCLGSVPMEQMKREYEQADVFVLPSLSEGQAGVLLEAMASGCPVVATRESGVDFQPGCGVSVPVGDVEALAEAIKSIVTDREKRTQLAEGALRQSVMFSMDEWKKRLVHVIEELG